MPRGDPGAGVDLIAAAVLAAGRGERFGDDTKLLEPLCGVPIVRRAVDAARTSGLAPVVVVVSDRAVAGATGADVEVVTNPDPDRGVSSSLRLVLEALADRAGVDAVVLGLGDQPLVGPTAYRRLAAAHAQGARLAAATYRGVRANPVLLDRSLWREAVALGGDVGARELMRDHAVQDVPCDDTGDPADVDRPEDLWALEARCASKTSSG